jgi:hypothetical protein
MVKDYFKVYDILNTITRYLIASCWVAVFGATVLLVTNHAAHLLALSIGVVVVALVVVALILIASKIHTSSLNEWGRDVHDAIDTNKHAELIDYLHNRIMR